VNVSLEANDPLKLHAARNAELKQPQVRMCNPFASILDL
jgi:hypothetical protein